MRSLPADVGRSPENVGLLIPLMMPSLPPPSSPSWRWALPFLLSLYSTGTAAACSKVSMLIISLVRLYFSGRLRHRQIAPHHAHAPTSTPLPFPCILSCFLRAGLVGLHAKQQGKKQSVHGSQSGEGLCSTTAWACAQHIGEGASYLVGNTARPSSNTVVGCSCLGQVRIEFRSLRLPAAGPAPFGN